MTAYRVRVVRVLRVVEEAFIDVQAEDREAAAEAANEADVGEKEWLRLDRSVEHFGLDERSF